MSVISRRSVISLGNEADDLVYRIRKLTTKSSAYWRMRISHRTVLGTKKRIIDLCYVRKEIPLRRFVDVTGSDEETLKKIRIATKKIDFTGKSAGNPGEARAQVGFRLCGQHFPNSATILRAGRVKILLKSTMHKRRTQNTHVDKLNCDVESAVAHQKKRRQKQSFTRAWPYRLWHGFRHEARGTEFNRLTTDCQSRRLCFNQSPETTNSSPWPW